LTEEIDSPYKPKLIQSYCKPLLSYACECFNMTRSEISQFCRAWRCVYWKVFKVSTDEAIDLIHVRTALCALVIELSPLLGVKKFEINI